MIRAEGLLEVGRADQSRSNGGAGPNLRSVLGRTSARGGRRKGSDCQGVKRGAGPAGRGERCLTRILSMMEIRAP